MSMALYSRLTHRHLAADLEFLPAYLDRVTARVTAPTAKVVELGIGGDPLVARALGGRCTVLGFDRRPERVDNARRSVPDGEFFVADFREIELEPRSVDVVVSFYAMNHLPAADLQPMVMRLARWLRPGGFFVGSLGSSCTAFPNLTPPELTCMPAGQLLKVLRSAGLTPVRDDAARWSDAEGSVEFTFFEAMRPGA